MLLRGFFTRTIIAPLMFEKMMFREYEEFCSVLRQAFTDMGYTEKFVWDLEKF